MNVIKIPYVFQASATELLLPDNYFDAVFTDPLYYDNVPYSYLLGFLLRLAQKSLRRFISRTFLNTTNSKI